ncbi:flavodoxin domain-containing protein [Meiothermus rufus]|uniref:flavodoxin domain-containing protein n=1 Tax=Meiothermus rufus TaxID=604332 RepID=UPI00146C4752|nr:flavodoxin domain-containing protein [Meiothermus rufus]
MQVPRILLAYASRHGSTQEVAQAIAAVLVRRGMEVEIRPVEGVQDLEGYQAVLLGSPVQDQAWLPEARRFVQTHHQALRRLPLVYFALSGVLGDPTPEHFHEVYGYWPRACRKVIFAAGRMYGPGPRRWPTAWRWSGL